MIVPAESLWIVESVRLFLPFFATFIIAGIPLVRLWHATGRKSTAGQQRGRHVWRPAEDP
jgi:hypothetical protein